MVEQRCTFDAVTCDAAGFAEQKVGSGTWHAIVVHDLPCDRYQPRSGGFISEQCWEFELVRDDRPSFRKAVDIVMTTDGDFIKIGESRTLSR